MIDLRKQYREAKKLAKQLMKAGQISEYLKTLADIRQLQIKMAIAGK